MAFNKYPAVEIPSSYSCYVGWTSINEQISAAIAEKNTQVVTIECYHGVNEESIEEAIKLHFGKAVIIKAQGAFKSESEISALTYPDITDDRIFGRISQLSIGDFIDGAKCTELREQIATTDQLVFVIGIGASVITGGMDSLKIYADMARWEIQLRMRKDEVSSLGLNNATDPFETLYKRGYFLDWRVCDKVKREGFNDWDFWLDTNTHDSPKMISHGTFVAALDKTVAQPFSVVPFFDPGPWGGQWMREKFDLDKDAPNFAWCFNCVPEENSLLLNFDGVYFETPSSNTVFFRPDELLGNSVRQQFGEEFPIRFDFLDTIDGGNLSLQVHPLTEYIQEQFGMTYTQDESYYMLDADEDACVYLGLKTNVDGEAMISDLKKAQADGSNFDAEAYTEAWPAKKHDHFLIPAGTVHCSGKGCLVLEISATPYIFTFKLWDWGRIGLDGKPRPINIEHGSKVIQWDRQADWTKDNLINKIETVNQGEGWREERTGLHELEFIETRRHWQTTSVSHETNGTVNVLMLIEGEEAIVESPENAFEPFVVNYAEAFIIPAKIDQYTIRPYGTSEGKEIATIKAYVRN